MRDFRVIGLDDPVPQFAPNWIGEAGEMAVGPDSARSTNRIVIDDDETRRFRNHEERVIVYSCVEYCDIFTASTTVCRSEVSAVALHHGGFQETPNRRIESVSFGPIGNQNSQS